MVSDGNRVYRVLQGTGYYNVLQSTGLYWGILEEGGTETKQNQKSEFVAKTQFF